MLWVSFYIKCLGEAKPKSQRGFVVSRKKKQEECLLMEKEFSFGAIKCLEIMQKHVIMCSGTEQSRYAWASISLVELQDNAAGDKAAPDSLGPHGRTGGHRCWKCQPQPASLDLPK